MYQFKQIIGRNDCPYHFKKTIFVIKRLVIKDVLQQTAELRARVGRPQLVEVPSNFIAGRPKTTLLFCFFGDFGCGVFVIYGYFR